MQARALFFQPPRTVTLEPVDIPDPEAGEVLVAVSHSATSPGTELRSLAGLQVGAPAEPFIPGYALAGRVVASRAQGLPEGTRVCMAGTTRAGRPRLWGGHVSHAIAPAGAVTRVPDAVNGPSAAFAHIVAIPHRGLELGAAKAGETVIVVGLGMIGLSSALLHATTGARVIAVDRAEARVALARALGLEVASGLDAARELVPDGADVIVDASGVPAVLAQAIGLARLKAWADTRPGPRVVLQGSYAGDLQLPYDAAFQREISLILPRDRYAHNVQAVLGLLETGALPDLERVVSVIAAEDAPGVYADWQAGDTTRIAAAFSWS